MSQGAARGYTLRRGEGWTYHSEIDFTVKAGERGQGRRVAVMEYTTRRGEEPPEHTHPTGDEIFYVLKGALTFQCGEDTSEVDEGGFVFLPRGIPHGYTIRSDGDVVLLVVTAPAHEDTPAGWGGFIGDVESQGQLRARPPARV